ncbi:hypothetical protein PAMC26510_25150 [Caballeronia sordidicola]|uniref:Uncharacterized protein n=1 Tax=Caballeronia sordidicola TaxID=196367 RepID=A0A242MHI0_CABSO|nr:hypothetical protein PAMC26510_25150 [Caballeronia sordidicola]
MIRHGLRGGYLPLLPLRRMCKRRFPIMLFPRVVFIQFAGFGEQVFTRLLLPMSGQYVGSGDE